MRDQHSMTRTSTAFDAAVDSLTSMAAVATFAFQAGMEAFAAARKEVTEVTTIDVTATTTSGPSETTTPRVSAQRATALRSAKPPDTTKPHAAKPPARPRLIARVTLSPTGLKEKELLLSGPHSPLWRGSSATAIEEDWGI